MPLVLPKPVYRVGSAAHPQANGEREVLAPRFWEGRHTTPGSQKVQHNLDTISHKCECKKLMLDVSSFKFQYWPLVGKAPAQYQQYKDRSGKARPSVRLTALGYDNDLCVSRY